MPDLKIMLDSIGILSLLKKYHGSGVGALGSCRVPAPGPTGWAATPSEQPINQIHKKNKIIYGMKLNSDDLKFAR